MTAADTRSTIVQLLSNMSDGKEIRSYLQRFSEVGQTRFAVIKIGGAILRDQLEETAAALAFLHTVGLTPIVLHGGGPQLDEALKTAGVETPKIDGLRVTPPAALDVARDVFVAENIRLVEAVRAQGVSAHSVTTSAIEANYLDKEKYGLVGEPTRVRLGLLNSIVGSGAMPILTCLGFSPGGQLLNTNGDSATRALVSALQPMKVIFLTGVGGLLDKRGELMHALNLATDYEKLMAANWVEGGMRLKLQEIKRLLETLPLSSSVSITTPSGLIKELFTHGGSGTLVRLGEAIGVVNDKSNLDQGRTVKLVENAFRRTLVPGWFDGVDLLEAHMAETYRAGAILTRLGDVTYLDKFAVMEEARGEGLSRTIWRQFSKRHPTFYWRSRTANGFNDFYHSVADGSVRAEDWTVFWVGETKFSAIEAAVGVIARLPESFVE